MSSGMAIMNKRKWYTPLIEAVAMVIFFASIYALCLILYGWGLT